MADIRRTFRTIWKFLVPGWLARGQGELVLYVQGLLKDAYAERCAQTALLPYPSVCVSDALDLHGRSRALPRGTFEADDQYRTRLLGWRFPRGHRVRGTALAFLEQFSLALRGTQHVSIDARGTRYEFGVPPPALTGQVWAWDAQSLLPNWARYWLVCHSIGAPWPAFTDPGWLAAWEDPGAVLAGSGITYGELAAVVSLASVERLGWSPAGTLPNTLVLYFAADPFPVPGGDWDAWANRDAAFRYVPLHESVA